MTEQSRRGSAMSQGPSGAGLAAMGSGLPGAGWFGRSPHPTRPTAAVIGGSVGLLHEFAVDGPGGLELLRGAAEVFFGLEELLFPVADAPCELLVGEFAEHAFGEEVIGGETRSFGVGEAVLQRPQLLGESAVLGSAVL